MERSFKNIQFFTENLTPSYNSLLFFCGLLIFLAVYFLLRWKKAKQIWILIANVAFYIWEGWAVFGIVAATSVIVYVLTLRMEDIYCCFERRKKKLELTPKEETILLKKYKKRAKKYLWLGFLLILSVWIYVKIGKLWGAQSVHTIQDWISGKGILVPLGISYYSLSVIGYLLDVFWRKTKPERNFICLLMVMTYFPHIIQGPISKYSQLFAQFESLPGFDYERVCFGLQRMIWGYIKKIVIADRLVIYTSAVFSDPSQYAGVEIVLAVILSIFQLYADFGGCMDIVCGISSVIGVQLEENFRQPLFSKSAAEFWTRWHITLGAWTKEYIYLPIAMNPNFLKWTRKVKKSGKPWSASFVKAFLPLVTVWLFTGIWHGTGWDYVVWGMYWCALMTLAKETKPLCDKMIRFMKIDVTRKYYKLWQSVRTCLLFGIGRMFTVTGSLAGCLLLWQRLWCESKVWVLFDGSLYQHGLEQKDFYIALLGIVLILVVDLLHEQGIRICQVLAAQPVFLRWVVYYGAIFTVIVLGYYGPGYQASGFVYGAF